MGRGNSQGRVNPNLVGLKNAIEKSSKKRKLKTRKNNLTKIE